MKKYELTVVLRGTLSDTEAPNTFQHIQDLLSGIGCMEIDFKELGKHRLAFSIKQNQFAHYGQFVFSVESVIAHTLRGKLQLEADIIRFALEDFAPARHKKQAVIASSPLIKTDRTDEDRERARAEREEVRVAEPVFSSAAPIATKQTEPAKEIDLAEIDKKLDELLQGDLTPAI